MPAPITKHKLDYLFLLLHKHLFKRLLTLVLNIIIVINLLLESVHKKKILPLNNRLRIFQ